MRPLVALVLALGLAGEAFAAARVAPAVAPTWTRESARDVLAAHRRVEGVVETRSGLQYRILEEGAGCRPKPGSKVRLHYTLHLAGDDVVIDDSRARGGVMEVALRDMIRAWEEGIPLMREGALWEFTVPPALAYGARGSPPSVPPHAVLVFQVELVEALACAAPRAGA